MLKRVHKGPKPEAEKHETNQVQTIIGIYSKLLASSWSENAIPVEWPIAFAVKRIPGTKERSFLLASQAVVDAGAGILLPGTRH